MTQTKSKTGIEALHRIRALLAELLVASDQAREPVAEILKLLQALELDYRAAPLVPTRLRPPRMAPDYAEWKYEVTRTGHEEVLTEHRLSGKTQPFRCPRRIYDELAKVFSEAEEPLSFTQMVHRVARRMPHSPPGEFQIRLCLRFWVSHQPPLIERARARYRAPHPSQFFEQAQQTWDGLSSQK